MDKGFIISAAIFAWMAIIVALHDSWLSEPFWGIFMLIYKFHHDHLRGPLWFHILINKAFNKIRPLQLGKTSFKYAYNKILQNTFLQAPKINF